jgi:hypothetical protein
MMSVCTADLFLGLLQVLGIVLVLNAKLDADGFRRVVADPRDVNDRHHLRTMTRTQLLEEHWDCLR